MTRFTCMSPFSVFGLAAPIAAGVLALAGTAHAQDGANPRAGLIQGSDGMLYGTTSAGGVGGFDGGTVFRMAPDGGGFTLLHIFGSYPTDGSDPGGLNQGPDGTIYGTTANGGTNNAGTIFRLAPDGSDYTILYSFGYGSNPEGGLIQGPDGTLYGTTAYGGSGNCNRRCGTVFQIAPDGTGDAILHSFTGPPTDGANPRAGLIQGPDGTLYGTTYNGGSAGCATGTCGTVFQMAPDGSGFALLHKFIGAPTDGANPLAGLIQGPDGTLYGTTQFGGSTLGTVFKTAPDGSGFTLLHSFTPAPTDGRYPAAGLIQGLDGTLYGTTASDGANNAGTIFRLAPDGSGFTLLHSFTGGPTDGAHPVAGLILGSDGTLYGTTINGGPVDRGTVFQLAPDGSGFTLLHGFTGTTASANPYAGLIQGFDGTFYGTTANGGRAGRGTVFQLALDGSGFTQLHSFTGTLTDGTTPYAGLIQGSDGTLYGTTAGTTLDGGIRRGTVFKMAPDGSGFTQLHSFTDTPDGNEPRADLIQGSDGMLYGTTLQGGSVGYGTVFRLAPDGSDFTLLHSFTRTPTDGGSPNGRLFQGSDGTFYGTTQYGGSDGLGGGTVFKMAPDGSGFTLLHSFTGNPPDEGAVPDAGLIQGFDGMLYGTTEQSFLGGGTVFKMAPDGAGFTLLHNFRGAGDGAYPHAGLIQGSDGTLYGTTQQGGSTDGGTIFQIAPDGSGFTILHSFTGGPTDGAAPGGDLIQGSDGALYGTTVYGGSVSRGTVFKMAPDGSGYTLLTSFTDTPTETATGLTPRRSANRRDRRPSGSRR